MSKRPVHIASLVSCAYPASHMPTASYYSALFAAGPGLWQYPKWQERTKFAIPPFSDSATTTVTGLDEHELSAVKALSLKVHAIKPHQKVLEALLNERDNDSAGRRAWESWAKKRSGDWKVFQDIEAVLLAEGRHPRQLIGKQDFVSAHAFYIRDMLTEVLYAQGDKVPPMDEVGVTEVFGVIGERLFGDDAFRDPDVMRPILKEEISKFISSLVAHVWNNMRKRVVNQYERLRKGKEDVNAEYDSAQVMLSLRIQDTDRTSL
jgi:hypothetical protein